MDKAKKFLGARIETEIMDIVDTLSRERNIDRTGAIKILVKEGWKEINLKKALDLYRDGKISIDKAAKIADITVSEMMRQAAINGIKSDQTFEEYKNGVKILLESK